MPQPFTPWPRLVFTEPSQSRYSRELTGWSETPRPRSETSLQLSDDIEKGGRGQRLTQDEKVMLAQLTTHDDFQKLYGSGNKGWISIYWTNVTIRFMNE